MAIAFIANSTCFRNQGNSGTGPTSAMATAVGAGNCIVLVVCYTTSSSALSKVSAVSDNGSPASSVYSRVTQVAISTSQGLEIWSTPATGSASSVTTITLTCASSTSWAAVAAAYSGGTDIGTTNTNIAISTTATLAITTEDNNNFIISAFGNGATSQFTATAGTIRINTTSTTTVAALADNTTALPAPSSVSVTATLNNAAWGTAGFDLRMVRCNKLMMSGVGP